jgi:4-hydroxybenzoate polyprenyltransferase
MFKRVTWLAHLWLGAVDGLAPMGAWIAIRGDLPWQAWALGGAVACWVAGFDLFYSLFDVEIDRAQGLHSWTTRWGERGAPRRAVLHPATVWLLAVAGADSDVGLLY